MWIVDPKHASFEEQDMEELRVLDAVKLAYTDQRHLDTEAQLAELNRRRTEDLHAAFPLGWEDK